jgi:molybdopterin molybdotransferase
VLKKGTALGSVQIAVAASVAASIVNVFAKSRVAVLSTGDELVEIDQTPTGAQIRNSNSHMLVALLQRLGCEVTNLGIVRDEREKIRTAIEQGVQYDALFITGGMSMGEFDFVPKALLKLGAQFEISKLKIKPGKPFVYTRLNSAQCHVFGLPGNPVSAYVCTMRLAARILSRIAGGSPDPKIINAMLTTAMPANGPREFYIPALLNGNEVTPLNPNGSADIFTLARANGLLIRSETAPAAGVGDAAPVLCLA